MEVLKLIASEMSNKEIAQNLHIEKRTVDAHRQNLLNKLKAKNTVSLVRLAFEHKLIS
jgi:DNA-binding NarL/FixJ family response regulator